MERSCGDQLWASETRPRDEYVITRKTTEIQANIKYNNYCCEKNEGSAFEDHVIQRRVFRMTDQKAYRLTRPFGVADD